MVWPPLEKRTQCKGPPQIQGLFHVQLRCAWALCFVQMICSILLRSCSHYFRRRLPWRKRMSCSRSRIWRSTKTNVMIFSLLEKTWACPNVDTNRDNHGLSLFVPIGTQVARARKRRRPSLCSQFAIGAYQHRERVWRHLYVCLFRDQFRELFSRLDSFTVGGLLSIVQWGRQILIVHLHVRMPSWRSLSLLRIPSRIKVSRMYVIDWILS